jgi:hypothetical protein
LPVLQGFLRSEKINFSVSALTEGTTDEALFSGLRNTSMEKHMSSTIKIIDTGRTFFRAVVEWQRQVRSRNGTDDARRAYACRLLVQQGFGGLLIGGYPSGEASSSQRSRRHAGGHEQ